MKQNVYKNNYWYSVITPVKDDVRIIDLINSLIVQKEFNRIEYIIVFNGSSNKFVNDVSRIINRFRNCKTIVIPGASIPKAINTGIKRSSSNKVVIIDSDCALTENYFEKMHQSLKNNQVVNGKVVFIGDSWFSNLTARLRTYIYSQQSNYFYAPNLGLNKKVLEQCGYFNETLRYGFDSEFSHRLISNNYVSFFDKNSIVQHKCHVSISQEIRIWYHYGRGRCFRYSSGWFGKINIYNLLKCLFTPKIFYLKEGFLFNLFAFQYLVIRNIGFSSSLITGKYD